MLLALFLQNLGMGAGGAATPAPTPAAPAQARGGRGRRKFQLAQYLVELGEDKHYFWTQEDAEEFLRRQSRKLVKRAKAVARKTHQVTLPVGATPIPLPTLSPIPRFVVHGSDAIAMLSQQINAKIDAVLANPEYEGDLDDEDLLRIIQ